MTLIKTAALLSFTLLSLSNATAFADDFRMTRTLNDPVIITFCETELEAALLASAINSGPFAGRRDATEKAKAELKCHSEIQAKEYVLHKKTIVKPVNADRGYEILDVIYQPNNQHKFIHTQAIGEYTYDDTSCQPNALGGQVNRMETDKDGRLYLKKYMVTSTCINGKNKAVWKALN